ncbi:hypothetical protein BT96DRAFT_763049, partial [Gymnopus androsaceus JB14]
KIISITCDNASANTAMFEKLAEILPNLQGKDAQVRCFAHTINLATKGILHPFEPVKLKPSGSKSNQDD